MIRHVEGAHHLVAADDLDQHEGDDEGECGTLKITRNKTETPSENGTIAKHVRHPTLLV
jgi:hypothetical protein